MMCFCNQPCMYKGYKPREENKKTIKKMNHIGFMQLVQYFGYRSSSMSG